MRVSKPTALPGLLEVLEALGWLASGVVALPSMANDAAAGLA